MSQSIAVVKKFNIHYLKLWPSVFDAVKERRKTFELRADDRDPRFQSGDVLVLEEWDEVQGQHTGRRFLANVSYVLRGAIGERFGLKPGYCIMALSTATPEQADAVEDHERA